jgi:Excreted virulence factor EspC, type VII ESX diderm
MGEPHVTRVDIAAVRAVAHEFDTAAELLDNAVSTHLARLAFDGATAGRDHIARGDALRGALDRLSGELLEWSRAAAEIAAALQAGADRYADAELHSAARVG